MIGQETGRRIPVGETAVRVDRLLFGGFRHHIFQISATLFDLDDRDSTKAGMFSTFSSIFFGSGIVPFVNEADRMDVGTDPHMYEIDSPLAHGSFSPFSYTVGLRVVAKWNDAPSLQRVSTGLGSAGRRVSEDQRSDHDWGAKNPHGSSFCFSFTHLTSV
jgi:hypothetical protein